MWDGKLIRESTKQTSDKVAREEESKHRARLAKERDERNAAIHRLKCSQVLRCAECEKWFDAAIKIESPNCSGAFCSNSCRVAWAKKRVVIPTLAQFIADHFEPWARSTFEETCRNNWLWYRAGLKTLRKCAFLAELPLDCIGKREAAEFAAKQLAQGKQVSTVNSSLRVLRSVLHRAVEWGTLESAPKIEKLKGERQRERVVTKEEEMRYLAAAPSMLADVATVLVDTGLRPDECYRLRWEDIRWASSRHGRYGALLVAHGKTEAARRVLPMTPRVRFVLENRWEQAGKSAEGWVWPAPTRSGHIDHSSLKKQHSRTFRTLNEEAREQKRQPIRPFVLYAFRHTFLTRLGESGCDAWTLARLAGHSSTAISKRYVHPSDDAVLAAMERLSGHNFGHNPEIKKLPGTVKPLETAEDEGQIWRARRDSNSRPIAPEAIALSS